MSKLEFAAVRKLSATKKKIVQATLGGVNPEGRCAAGNFLAEWLPQKIYGGCKDDMENHAPGPVLPSTVSSNCLGGLPGATELKFRHF